jgi:hypothetical protein
LSKSKYLYKKLFFTIFIFPQLYRIAGEDGKSGRCGTSVTGERDERGALPFSSIIMHARALYDDVVMLRPGNLLSHVGPMTEEKAYAIIACSI